MIEPQIVNEVWPQVRLEWCVFLCKILMFLNALLILHCKYWYFASSGQSHWHLLEGVAELCVGDFLIESVYLGDCLIERGSCGGSYSNRSGGSHVHQDCLYNPSHPRKVYRPTKPPKQLPASFLQWNPHLQWHIAMSWHTVEGYGRAPRSKGEVDNIMILESSQRLKTYLDFFFWPEGAPGIILPQ